MRASIRFFIDHPESDKKLQVLLHHAGVSNIFKQTENYLQFSVKNCDSDFLVLQPRTYLTTAMINKLNSLCTKVTLMVSCVKVNDMIQELQPRRIFTAEIGDLKVSGVEGINGTYNLLFSAESADLVFDGFKSFVSGVHSSMITLMPNFRKMSFWSKLKLLFG